MDLPPAVHPDLQTPDLIEATLLELRSFGGSFHHGKNPVDRLAFDLTGFFLRKNWIGYQQFVIDEMVRRIPDLSVADAASAATQARSDWSDVYCA